MYNGSKMFYIKMAPGLDSLTMEFYQTVWPIPCDDFMAMAYIVLETGPCLIQISHSSPGK